MKYRKLCVSDSFVIQDFNSFKRWFESSWRLLNGAGYADVGKEKLLFDVELKPLFRIGALLLRDALMPSRYALAYVENNMLKDIIWWI